MTVVCSFFYLIHAFHHMKECHFALKALFQDYDSQFRRNTMKYFTVHD